jgi:hypothetical protein
LRVLEPVSLLEVDCVGTSCRPGRASTPSNAAFARSSLQEPSPGCASRLPFARSVTQRRQRSKSQSAAVSVSQHRTRWTADTTCVTRHARQPLRITRMPQPPAERSMHLPSIARRSLPASTCGHPPPPNHGHHLPLPLPLPLPQLPSAGRLAMLTLSRPPERSNLVPSNHLTAAVAVSGSSYLMSY